MVEGFPVRLHVAEVRSRVVGPHLQDLQAGVHLVEKLLVKVLSPVAQDVSK